MLSTFFHSRPDKFWNSWGRMKHGDFLLNLNTCVNNNNYRLLWWLFSRDFTECCAHRSLLIPKTTIKRLSFFEVNHLAAFVRPSCPSQINDQGFGRFCNLSLIAHLCLLLSFPGGTSSKELTVRCRRHKRCTFHPWVGKIPWRRKWQPTPIFLPGEPHGWRSLAGFSSWGCTESDTTEWLNHRHQHAS